MTPNILQAQPPAGIDPDTIVRGPFGPNDNPALGPDRAAEWLGYTVSEYGKGYVRAHMEIREDMLNGFDIAHGGMVFAFADTCFAWACNSPDSNVDTVTVTQGADINFTTSPTAGSALTAIGIQHPSNGRSGLCDVTVIDNENRLVAEFRGRFRIIARH